MDEPARFDLFRVKETIVVKSLNPAQARQGTRGRHVLIILGSSLVLMAVGWFAVETYGEAIDAQPTQLQTAS